MFRNVKNIQDSRTFQIIIQGVMIALSAGSILTASFAFYYMNQTNSQTDYILNNWNTKPIVHAVMVAKGETCPFGYTEGIAPMVWPGAEPLGCACHSGALDVYRNNARVRSSYGLCSDTQLRAGCVQDKGLEPIELATWRKGILCIKREGESAATFKRDFAERPNPVEGSCPDKFKKCGSGDFDKDRAICVPFSVPCPITFMTSHSELNPTAATPETRSYDENNNPFPDSTALTNTSIRFVRPEQKNFYIYGDVANAVIPSQLPVIELVYGFHDIRLPDHGPCFADEFISSTTYRGKSYYFGDNNSATTNYNENCKEFDDRWKRVDSLDEDEFMAENFFSQDQCSGLEEGEAELSDYLTTGQACSLDGHIKPNLQCEYQFPIGMTCDSNDDICNRIMKQTKCGHLVHFMTAQAAYRKVAIYARQQIYWSSTCDKEQEDIKSNANPVQKASDAENAFMWINLSANIILICISVVIIVIFSGLVNLDSLTGKAEDEERFIYTLQTLASTSICIVKIIPVIACIVLIGKAVAIFGFMKRNNCSDDLTIKSVSMGGENLPKILGENIGTILLDISQIVLIFTTAKKLSYQAKNRRAKQAESDEETPLRSAPGGI